MAESLRFQTRARTVDHLGREQIADCPTAISELWKNSYDAYARSASLQIFDGDPVVAAIFDDGHGMSREEFVDKWLVIGTESKLSHTPPPISDQNGLPYRTRQGKKGIGRLSSAYLASLLLLVSKRADADFVAALIDWRIFENPFLMLDDIRVPLIVFEDQSQFFTELPSLYDTMMSNVWGDSDDPSHRERIEKAWTAYDEMENRAGLRKDTTRAHLERILVSDAFGERHLREWSVWSGDSAHGTAMLMSGVIPDLDAELHPQSTSATDARARMLFRSTLWSFIDPFRELARKHQVHTVKDFTTSVIGWRGERRLPIIEHLAGFEAQSAENLEHIIDGHVDDAGTFKGRVKVFGQWLEDDVEIPYEEAVPTRIDSVVGEFDFYAATMELDKSKTTLSDEVASKLANLLESFSGLMVFRDGFRVMPYGRVDSDYFSIEERRSKNAGREFWNHRRMLGRIAISHHANPNLKDKAGREGIIDNKASKVFRSIVVNILTTSARLFFGSDSDIRKEKLPELKEAYTAKQRELEREKMLKQRRRQYRRRLEENHPQLEQLAKQVQEFRSATRLLEQTSDEDEGLRLQRSLSTLKQQYATFRLGPPPKDLPARLRGVQSDYREKMQDIGELIGAAENDVTEALNRLSPKRPAEVAKAEVESQLRHVRRRILRWNDRIDKLLESEKASISLHGRSREDFLTSQLIGIPADVESGRIGLTDALRLVEETAARHDVENERQFESLISALESLNENINIDLLATDTSEEVAGLRTEVDRLTALAQLGIAVEIVDHELSSFTATIDNGLKRFSQEVRETQAYKQVQAGYQGLAGRLSFLAPLKLSGDPVYKEIFGSDILSYLVEFFDTNLRKKEFELVSTESFQRFSVNEQTARIYPVFVNLVNNSRYWLHQVERSERRVLLSTFGDKVLVSDNGPGISSQDQPDLLRLFFTRRQGGRGVGLYLCRSNLAAGGHNITYATEERLRPLDGATFVIEFREASFPL